MRSKAAFSGVSRSEYLLFSIVLFRLLFFLCEVAERSSRSHHILTVEKTEIPFCLARHTDRIYWKRMDLRHLRYFVAVAEKQNLTRPALRIPESQRPLCR